MKLLRILMFALCLAPFISFASKPLSGARDMVLIYAGGTHRGEWNKEKFAPYVSMTDETGKPHWLFDGFLFLEIKNGEGRGFASYYEKQGARKQEWTKLLNDYLTPGKIICALNDCIGDAKKINSKKFTRKKIVIGLPEPIPNQKDWGEIDGTVIDFSNAEHRLSACRWFIDTAIEKFKQANLKNLELVGFYWIAEEATNSRKLANNVSDYIKSKKMTFNWIPYYQSEGYTDWKSLGFDIAYLQPNYFFNEKIPFERLDNACKVAEENGMSIEMEFDDRALNTGKFAYRLTDYMNAFEKHGVFNNLPIAYYQGNLAFYNMFHSNDSSDKQLYMKLAKRIAQRQEMKNLKRAK